MKQIFALLAAMLLAAVGSYHYATSRAAARHAAHLAEREAAWLVEKAGLEAAVREASSAVTLISPARLPPLEPSLPPGAVASQPSPREALDRLVKIRITPGAGYAQGVRAAIAAFENLVAAGPEALPVIREFLARHQDIEYDANLSDLRRGWKNGQLATDFMLAPTLRLGLLDAVRRIGGDQAEQMLAEVLSNTGRAMEVAYLSSMLKSIAPGRYRDLALSASRDLLASPPAVAQPTRWDRNDYLYGVLRSFGDAQFAPVAQAQLVRGDGQIESEALNYLRDTLGEQALPGVAQAYQDPRLTDPTQKQPLVDFIVNYVGASPQANELFYAVVMDANLPLKLRERAIKDLDNPFAKRPQLSPQEQQLILSRMQVLEALAPDVTDPKLRDRVGQIYQNLQGMLAKSATPPAP
jgi:hypothetical protein